RRGNAQADPSAGARHSARRVPLKHRESPQCGGVEQDGRGLEERREDKTEGDSRRAQDGAERRKAVEAHWPSLLEPAQASRHERRGEACECEVDCRQKYDRFLERSEERRVGKEGKARRWANTSVRTT